MLKENIEGITIFEKYLTVWVIICIIAGIAVGQFLPIIPNVLHKFEYAKVSIPVAILIWIMIYPMMLKVDFSSIIHSGKKPKGLILTLIVNWLIKPFTMYFWGWFFLKILFGKIILSNLDCQHFFVQLLFGHICKTIFYRSHVFQSTVNTFIIVP